MFSFDGVHANTFGMKVSEIKRGILPPVQNTLYETQARHGGILARKRISPLQIEIKFHIVGNDPANLRSKARQVASWLYADDAQLRPLVFDDEPDLTFYATVDAATDFTEVLRVGSGTIVFLCPIPFGFTALETVTMTSNSVTVTNSGDVKTFPTITLIAKTSATSLSVTNTTTGEVMRLNGNFIAGDTVKVNSETGLVTLNNTPNLALFDVSGNFITLNTGQNVITADITKADVSIQFRERYL